MADFAWGLKQRGHQVQVITSDSPGLGRSSSEGPTGEKIERNLLLKGSYEGGVKPIKDRPTLEKITAKNTSAITKLWQQEGPFDGVLVGNIDLLGIEVVDYLLRQSVRILHHVGFMNPPYHPKQQPKSTDYKLVGASKAVSEALEKAGLANRNTNHERMKIPVVYPGVRADLFGQSATGRTLPAPLNGNELDVQLGTRKNPLRVCFAGLLMGSKGAHTLVEALIILKQKGIFTEGHIAGSDYQPGYREKLETLLKKFGIDGVHFTGQLKRKSLARFYRLHHVCVFPSIHPEAFGIVGAEAMASGLTLVSSGVGGSAELLNDQKCGLKFREGDAEDLAKQLEFLCQNPNIMSNLSFAGKAYANNELNVSESVRQLETLFLKEKGQPKKNMQIF